MNSILWFFATFLIALSKSDESCAVNELSYSAYPFVLKLDGSFYRRAKIDNGQEAIISCQNYKFKKYPTLSTMKVTCENGTLITEAKKVLELGDPTCEKSPIDIMKCNVKGCQNPLVGLCFVYYDTTRHANNKIADSCFDINRKRVAFTQYYVNPKDVPTNEMFLNDDVKLTEFPERSDLNISVFLLAEEYIHQYFGQKQNVVNTFFATTSLIPSVIMHPQFNFVDENYINTVSIWLNIEEGNWANLQLDVKDYIENKNEPVDMKFGSYRSLKSRTGKVMVANDKSERFPQYIWVSLHEKNENKGVAIVIINDPFLTEDEIKEQVFCKSICNTIPWLERLTLNKFNERPALGYAFCCALEDFNLDFNE